MGIAETLERGFNKQGYKVWYVPGDDEDNFYLLLERGAERKIVKVKLYSSYLDPEYLRLCERHWGHKNTGRRHIILPDKPNQYTIHLVRWSQSTF